MVKLFPSKTDRPDPVPIHKSPLIFSLITETELFGRSEFEGVKTCQLLPLKEANPPPEKVPIHNLPLILSVKALILLAGNGELLIL